MTGCAIPRLLSCTRYCVRCSNGEIMRLSSPTMTVCTRAFECTLGIVFMFAAFFGGGIRGAFTSGPYHPVSKAGKFITFLMGAAALTDGLQWLLAGYSQLHALWRYAVPLFFACVFALILNSRYIRARAGRITNSPPMVAIAFRNRLPFALVAARIAFFVIVAAMLVFGLAPMPDSAAWRGVIGCVLALFALAFVYAALEQHYLNTGCAREVNLPLPPSDTEP